MTKRVISAGIHRRWFSAAGAAICFVMANSPPLRAQSKPDAKQFTAVVSAGLARPADQALRELYGSVLYPLSVQGEYELRRNVLVFGAFGHVRRTGRTQVMDSSFVPANDVIKFRMNTVKAGLLYALHLRKITLLGGGGAGFHFYRETWEAAAATTKGSRAGFMAQGGAEYALTRSLALVGRVEYAHVTIKAKSEMENDASLGRLEMSLGLALHLTRLWHK